MTPRHTSLKLSNWKVVKSLAASTVVGLERCEFLLHQTMTWGTCRVNAALLMLDKWGLHLCGGEICPLVMRSQEGRLIQLVAVRNRTLRVLVFVTPN